MPKAANTTTPEAGMSVRPGAKYALYTATHTSHLQHTHQGNPRPSSHRIRLDSSWCHNSRLLNGLMVLLLVLQPCSGMAQKRRPHRNCASLCRAPAFLIPQAHTNRLPKSGTHVQLCTHVHTLHSHATGQYGIADACIHLLKHQSTPVDDKPLRTKSLFGAVVCLVDAY